MPRSPRQFREKLADGEAILAKMTAEYERLVGLGSSAATEGERALARNDALNLHLRIIRVEATNEKNRAAITRLEFNALHATLKAAAIVDGIGICEGCGLRVPELYAMRALACRHALPIAEGGGNEPGNLVLVCLNCDAIADVLLSLRREGDEAPNRASVLAALKANPLNVLR